MLKSIIQFGLFEARRVFDGLESGKGEVVKAIPRGPESRVASANAKLDQDCQDCEEQALKVERHQAVRPGGKKSTLQMETVAMGAGFEQARREIGLILNRLQMLAKHENRVGMQPSIQATINILNRYHVQVETDGLEVFVYSQGKPIDIRNVKVTDDLVAKLATYHVDRIHSN